jgi:hypothetical protein
MVERKQRTVRIDDDIYDRLQAISERTRVPIADLVRQALHAFIEESSAHKETPSQTSHYDLSGLNPEQRDAFFALIQTFGEPYIYRGEPVAAYDIMLQPRQKEVFLNLVRSFTLVPKKLRK